MVLHALHSVTLRSLRYTSFTSFTPFHYVYELYFPYYTTWAILNHRSRTTYHIATFPSFHVVNTTLHSVTSLNDYYGSSGGRLLYSSLARIPLQPPRMLRSTLSIPSLTLRYTTYRYVHYLHLRYTYVTLPLRLPHYAQYHTYAYANASYGI